MTEPIYDEAAERALLGAALFSRKAHEPLLSLESSDFYVPVHGVIGAIIREMVTKDLPIDPITVHSELDARNKTSMLRGLGGAAYLHALSDNASADSAAHYAETIRSATCVREAHFAAVELAASTGSAQSVEYFAEVMAKHRERLDLIPGPISTDDEDEHDLLAALLQDAEQPVDWVIPGHMAHGDRAVIVAAEGVAKTTICRQLAVCYSGGLNPWTGARVADGARVLYVDAENSRAQSSRAYKWIAGRCYSPVIAHGWKERILHKTRNDGVDLVGKDNQWFRNLADRFAPDVVIVGPAYKLMRGDPQKDRDVQDLIDAIDKVRVLHNAAVIVETHAPHGHAGGRDMRPYGSSVWLRWPEIILGYQRDTNIAPEFQPAKPEFLEAVDARGRREPRDWPDRIRYGSDKELPWVPTDEWWKPSIQTHYVIPEGEAA
jgi:replicative DNA helicase